MTVHHAEAIYWRRLTETDLKAKLRYWGNEDGGGVHSRIYLPGDPEKIAKFFRQDDWEADSGGSIHVRLEPVEQWEGSGTELEIDYNNGRDEWQLPSWSTDYPLWNAENGFIPNAEQMFDEERENLVTDFPPLLYFVRDVEQKFHSRALYDTSPERLRSFNLGVEGDAGEDASDIINFGSGSET